MYLVLWENRNLVRSGYFVISNFVITGIHYIPVIPKLTFCLLVMLSKPRLDSVKQLTYLPR